MLIRKAALSAALFLIIIALGGWFNYKKEAAQLRPYSNPSADPSSMIRTTEAHYSPSYSYPPFRPREYVRIIRFSDEQAH